MPLRPRLRTRLRTRLVVCLLVLSSVTALALFATRNLTHAAFAAGRDTSRSSLLVRIPVPQAAAGAGRLALELVDPEDHVLGHSERRAEIAGAGGAGAAGGAGGAWKQSIVPDAPLAFDDAVWERVRWRFTYDDATKSALTGVEPMADILLRPVVRILGQTDYLAGSQAAVRVVVTDGLEGSDAGLVESGTVRILLAPAENPQGEPAEVFHGKLDRRGSLEAQLRLPAGLTGAYTLHFVVATPIGTGEYTQTIHVQDSAQILLTTEKPTYQPGQVIHVRALALDRAEHHAVAGRKLTFEIEDSRGNKVLKKMTQTDRFGIASAEFQLADEVNLGTYHLRALMGDPQSPANTAELALQVDRYVLPKFKVAVEFDKKDGKTAREKRDFRPGDHVTGTVHANYFFGKPVEGAAIDIKASAMDVELLAVVAAAGRTDGDGAYRFDLKLPDYFAGRPSSAGAARVLVEASVKDSAAHTETRGEPITVSQSALLITAVPEGGQLTPGLENQVYVLTSYPDGTPAATTVSAKVPGAPAQEIKTDASGVAVMRVKPAAGTTELRLAADDHQGSGASAVVPLEARGGTEQILLRSDRAVVKAGDKVQLTVRSTRLRGAAYLDVVRNGQTVLTRDVELEDGRAELTLNATAEMAGTLDIDAYVFGRDAEVVADHRLLFVQPADELRITSAADAAMYKPGGEATIRFHVANRSGQGVSAALGVQIVDEAVFALAEKQPGFAKTFFYLEQEVMKPRFEIHSLSYDRVTAPPLPGPSGDLGPQDEDQDAQALFSATELARPHTLQTEFGRVLPRERYAAFEQRYRMAFEARVKEIDARLEPSLGHVLRGDTFLKAFEQVRLADGSTPRDAWGGKLQISARYRNGRSQYFEVRSAGPDHLFNTADDLVLMIHEAPAPAPTTRPAAASGSGMELTMEHDRGPQNGLAETAGVIEDTVGAVIPQADVSLRRLPDGALRTTHSDASGNFTLSALQPGEYELSISAPGFVLTRRRFAVQARDRAVIHTTLAVGDVSETVNVSTDTVLLQTEAAPVPMMLEERMMQPMAAGRGMQFAAAAPARAMMADGMEARMADATHAKAMLSEDKPAAGSPAGAAPHVRSYFPESLYINPEIITDGHGDASITIPVADSITTWRMAMMASTERGALGSGTSSLKVFQDFFVDLDLPVRLTQGDQVTVPVAIYNYSGAPGQVRLQLEPDKWFTLPGDQAQKTVASETGQVGGSSFTLRADRIGKFKLTLAAHMDGAHGQPGRDDILVREIEVVPNGQEQNLAFNGRLDHMAEQTLTFPAGVVPDATTLFVRLYPGPLSQLVEGMDSILRMPYGCFEQTSSATYPNVLALDYMKQTGKLTPEVHAKAEGFIVNGYQRLLTFEVPGGGFSWFGQTPANKILTAYGLMEFHDMAQVSEVDPRLIERTAQWLASQQQPDGSWKPDSSFINEGATNRFNSDTLRITAYLAWGLENAGYKGPAVERAQQYIEAHAGAQAVPTSGAKSDPYTLAVIANFAVEDGRDRDFTQRAMQALLDARIEKDGQVFWDAQETGFYTTGQSAATETTGLATQALLKWGQSGEIARKALAYLAAKKQADGTWGTTQATIMALRSLLLAAKIGTADTRGTVEVSVDGKRLESLTLTADNNDLLHQIVVHDVDPSRPARVTLRFTGSGGLAYQIVGRYFTPWPAQPEQQALTIDVGYDRTRLAENDTATATAHIHNNLRKTANLVMVDLGIPPGFELLSEDLQTMMEQTANAHGGKLEKFSQTATQAMLYFDALAPNQTVTVKYRLRAKYPVRARTFASRVYEYYTPDVNATALPVELEIRRK